MLSIHDHLHCYDTKSTADSSAQLDWLCNVLWFWETVASRMPVCVPDGSKLCYSCRWSRDSTSMRSCSSVTSGWQRSAWHCSRR